MARQATKTTGGTTTARTRAEKVAEVLREEILRGKLAPGEPLREIHLAKRLRVSRIPLREALRILEGEGLAVHRAHHGAVVRPLSQAEALDVLEVLALAEPVALKHAGPVLAKEDLDALDDVLARLRKEKDALLWLQLRDELLAKLFGPMNRPILQSLVTSHQRVGSRYLFTLLGDASVRQELERAYERLLRSVRRKEIDKASKALSDASQGIAAELKKRRLFADADGEGAKQAGPRRSGAKKRAAGKVARPKRRAS